MGAKWMVYAGGSPVSWHRTERAAVKVAEIESTQYDEHTPVYILLITRDGSYRASQRVWPTIGDIHTT